ncbi:MAG: hypothetical protein KBG15_19905 [Kofleriaceae bacterium]|nr:hypothetical protein [Kofleriaceae bacterium]
MVAHVDAQGVTLSVGCITPISTDARRGLAALHEAHAALALTANTYASK